MVLEVENLSKTFYSKQVIKAVDGINFNIKKGEIFGLLGPNGAGKTTTVKMICGLITPSEGEIRINNLSLRKNSKKVLKNIGVILEGSRNIYWRLTSWENVILFASHHGVKRKEASERAALLLKQLELYDRKDSLVGKLSRGMQQKVALTCALVKDPSLLLLDEPTLELDVMSATTVKSMMKKLKDEEKSVLLTTHNMNLAEEMCDRIAIIDHGKIIIEDSVSSLKNYFSTQRYQFVLEGNNVKQLFPEAKEETNGRSSLYLYIRDSDDLYNTIQST